MLLEYKRKGKKSEYVTVAFGVIVWSELHNRKHTKTNIIFIIRKSDKQRPLIMVKRGKYLVLKCIT